MNFLAHALLAGDADADRYGGLLGDFVKGPLPAGLPPALASGVALHRAIDSYADRHPAFIASRKRVSAVRRRVAGVLVDLFYDHLLARDWAEHSEFAGGEGNEANIIDDLAAYTAKLYAGLPAYIDELPPEAGRVAALMRDNDWLTAYRGIKAVGDAIDRMAVYRLRRANPLAGGIEEFIADADGFQADFRRFFPDALAYAAQWRAERLSRT